MDARDLDVHLRTSVINFDLEDDEMSTHTLTRVLIHPCICPPQLDSEEFVASFMYNMTGAVWTHLATLCSRFPFTHGRNTSDASGATNLRLRPDYCLWSNGALLLKAEHKANMEQLHVAKCELVAKMTGGWNTLAMRGLPFLPCYAAAGPLVQFCAVFPPTHSGSTPILWDVTDQINTISISGRLTVIKIALNMARVLSTLTTMLPPCVVKLYQRQERGNRSFLTIMNDHVIKVCYPAPDGVYACLGLAADQPALPCSIRVTSKKLRMDGTARLIIKPVCVELLPADEGALRTATRAVLTALAAFHAKGFVHRDIRWPNVLRDAQGGWRLADFELADAAGSLLPADAVAVSYLPPEVVASPSTVPYTCAGDVYRVGQLVREWVDAVGGSQVLSDTARTFEFVDYLTAALPEARPSANDALRHAWLR